MLKKARAVAQCLSLMLLANACATEGEETTEQPVSSAPVADEDGLFTGYIPGPTGEYMKVRYELKDGVALLGGDMRIDPLPAPPKEHMRAAMIKNKNWVGAVVPYEIGPGFTTARQNEIFAAIKDWNDNTPFWFTPRNGQADYVFFMTSDQCRSDIGRQGGKQDILVGVDCHTSQTAHEMGHAVGFFHEQSRQDRDTFINIDFTNVKDGKKGNFDKYLASNGEDYGPYEVESLMHYESLITDASFVKDTSKNTITRKDGTTWTRAPGLTGLDRAAAYRRADFMEPLKQKWLDFQWAIGFGLDKPLLTADHLGRFFPAQWGRTYVHILQPDPVVIYGSIFQKFMQLGADGGFLGRPVTDELGTPDGIGRYNHMQYGSIYWSPDSGANEVHGYIRDKWASMGWETSFLGYPVTDETGTPDGVGRYNHFQGGSIYWTANTGAFEVHGDIRGKWAEMGWETSILGYPLTDELGTPDGIGRYNHFQGGSIYWSPNTGAHSVYGLIREKWAQMGWETSFYGYPVTDELGTPDGVGRFNHFQAGSIYWTPTTGAHLVYGAIRDKWASIGWETSKLGYPTTDELPLNDGSGGRYNKFQGGTIKWTPAAGAWVELKNPLIIATTPHIPFCTFTTAGC